ncbi:MAG: DUF4097 domain-containing protein [Gammaproteobacteria bacterium]|nr:DUF4097 domain-containing protein [Gammaproteobacteria bacterium]
MNSLQSDHWLISTLARFNHRLLSVFALVMVTLGTSPAASAGGDRAPVNEIRDAATDGFVHIRVLRGRVEVSGWDKPQIQVSGVLDEELREFVFDVENKEARIEVKIPQKSEGWQDQGSDLTIHVPENSSVQITSISTGLVVENIQGGVEIGNVSGDIRASRVANRLEVDSVSGDITIRDARARLRVNTVSGDIDIDGAQGGRFNTVSGSMRLDNPGSELRLGSISGDIEIRSTTTTDISGQSVSGDIEISTALVTDGAIELDNASGSIRLALAGKVNAQFDIETGAGGSIRNRLTDDEPRVSKYVRNESLRFTAGSGEGEVTLSTASGDITLTQ